MFKVIGIDEAGKGPVIGSLVVGFSIINIESESELGAYQDHLKELGVKDSKLLSTTKRRELFNTLKNHMDIKFVQLTPSMIDNNNFAGGKLNDLQIKAIVQVLEAEKPNMIIIDALTADPPKFASQITSKLSFDPKIIAENKADVTYPLVGAASIIAKELREQEIEQVRAHLKADLGSGYPADPKTQKFIKENYSNQEIEYLFRKSWKTYKNLVKDEKQQGLDGFI